MSDELWFRFFPSKFMAGTRGLSANEVKVYISLLCRIYESNGPVANDPEVLATYCEVRPSSFGKALDRLVRLGKLYLTDDDHLGNTTSDEEISRRASRSEIAKRAAEKSAEKRQGKQRRPRADAKQTLSYIEEEKEEERDTNVSLPRAKRADLVPVSDFEAFWSLYPRKVGKGAAEKAYAKAVKLTTPDVLSEAAQALAAERNGKDPQYTPHPATWLNQRRWEDVKPDSPADFYDNVQRELDRLNGLSNQNSGDYGRGDAIANALPPARSPDERNGSGGIEGDFGSDQQPMLRIVQPGRNFASRW